MKTLNKIVTLPLSGSQRVVYYHPITERQVAVGTIEIRGVYRNFEISVPIQGYGGWTKVCRDTDEMQKIADRECSLLGKAVNRFLVIPLGLLSDALR